MPLWCVLAPIAIVVATVVGACLYLGWLIGSPDDTDPD